MIRNNFIILTMSFSFYFSCVKSRGILILHKPLDITYDCASSTSLRYDLSFGMGMSDTITVILRTLPDADYSCEIDITTDKANKLVVVIRFPTTIGYNCEHNPHAFHVMKYDSCFPVCDDEELEFQDAFSNYWILFTQGRFRFQFRNNASINADIDAFVYEVTVTTARLRDKAESTCYSTKNETECWAPLTDEFYCMTSAVVCDGIKNCGTIDWFDERQSECDKPIQTLGYLSIIAVMSLLICGLIALAHILGQCLPRATSFFIFHTDEINKFCIDPVFNKTGVGYYVQSDDFSRKKSLVPLNWTDSEDSDDDQDKEEQVYNIPSLTNLPETSEVTEVQRIHLSRKSLSAALTMPQRLGQRLKSVVEHYREQYLPRTSNTASLEDQRRPSSRTKPTLL